MGCFFGGRSTKICAWPDTLTSHNDPSCFYEETA